MVTFGAESETEGDYGGVVGGYGGFWRRFGAGFVDAAAVGLVAVILSFSLEADQVALWDFVFSFSYYVLGNAWGGTPGKRVLGLRVVNAAGGVPGLARALIRHLVAGISLLALLMGYFWMLWDAHKQTWHDKAAGTYVIHA